MNKALEALERLEKDMVVNNIYKKQLKTIREALQWRPISEAPRDGAEIVVTDGENVCPSVWADPEEWRDYGAEGGWCSPQYHTGGMLYEGVTLLEPQPTHFMLLPPAPQGDE